MKRSSPLSRNTPLKAKTPLKKKNARRARERYEENFGSKADFIRTFPCIVPEYGSILMSVARIGDIEDMLTCEGSIEAMHGEHSRGADGDDKDLIPCCHKHHTESHRGIETFCRKYGLNMRLAVDLYEALWELAA